MTIHRRTLLAGAFAGLAVASLAAAPAYARQDARSVVNAAKAQGIVGEMADGFVGARQEGSVTPAIRAAMAEMNAGRAELYRNAGQSAGTTAAAAGASSFQQRFSSIPAGQWYRDASGTWRQK